MPKSKGRKKAQHKRYQLEKPAKTKRRSSPRWYGPLLLAVMGVGVLLIVLNYVGLIPGTNGVADPIWLWVGLGFLGAGFVGTAFWR